MNKEQEAFFGMALKVKNFQNKNAAAMTAVPAVAPFFMQLEGFIGQLIAADTGSRADIKGYALSKAAKRQAIEVQALKVSNAIASYAMVNGDFVLQKRADFPSSKWYSYSEEELVTQATIVRNLAQPLGVTLEPFGAAVADVALLDTALTNFTNVISDPSLAIDQRKEDNVRVVEAIDSIRTLLSDKLDVLMRSFEVNQPTLYALYKGARAIDSNGSVMTPTASFDLLPQSTVTAHTAKAYEADTFYTLQNLSSEDIYFSLSEKPDIEGPEIVLLRGGETRSRLADNLAPYGTYLILRNPGNGIVKTKVWVE